MPKDYETPDAPPSPKKVERLDRVAVDRMKRTADAAEDRDVAEMTEGPIRESPFDRTGRRRKTSRGKDVAYPKLRRGSKRASR